MKKFFALLIISAFTFGTIMAQDAEKDLKNGERSIKKFISDQSNVDALAKGLELFESAFKSDVVADKAKSWVIKGNLMKNVANAEFRNVTLDSTYSLSLDDAAVQSYEAYSKALNIAEKKNDKKSAQVGLIELENHLNNYAIIAYQAEDYKNAFSHFSTSIEASKSLKGLGQKSRLDDELIMNDQIFFAAISGYYSEDKEKALPYLTTMANQGTKEVFVYDALYNLTVASDPEKALAYLDTGMAAKPDDTSLLFTQINHYLKEGKLDQLISKLNVAIEKEPDNTSIYNTLGSVYDQLQIKESKAGNKDKAAEYFAKAKENYMHVLTADPTNFDATYSIGALYYNDAATNVDKLNELSEDLSPAGMKKYDAIKADMDAVFGQALPYFESASKLNDNDCNTIIALKEIYARLNDLEKSNIYKGKFETNCAGK